MLLIITFLVVFLIAINFILLVFSCNKTTKNKKPLDKNKGVVNVRSTKSEVESQLAPTGS